MVVYKIDRRGGWVQKSFTRTDPKLGTIQLINIYTEMFQMKVKIVQINKKIAQMNIKTVQMKYKNSANEIVQMKKKQFK